MQGLSLIHIFHPDMQNFKIDDYRYLKMYELCEGRLPMLIHMGDARSDFSHPKRLRAVMEIYDGLTVIAAHFGGYTMWEEASHILAGMPNLYTDCSSSFFALDDRTAVEIKMCIRDRVGDHALDSRKSRSRQRRGRARVLAPRLGGRRIWVY